MNDPHSTPGAPVPELPSPAVFLPGSGVLPGELAAGGAYPGPLVLLIDGGDDRVWAADAAVAIASAWARSGRRVVLADLHLEEPILHERVGESNLDGVVDIFLYGASVARSARPPGGHEFYLIPAGTYTATPGDVYGHPRWSKLVAGFQEANATLVAFAPSGATGVAALVERAEWAIVLGAGGEIPDELLERVDVRAVLVPAEGAKARDAAGPDRAAAPVADSTATDAADADSGPAADTEDRDATAIADSAPAESAAAEDAVAERDEGDAEWAGGDDRRSGAAPDEPEEEQRLAEEGAEEAGAFAWEREDAYAWRLAEEPEADSDPDHTPAWSGFPQPDAAGAEPRDDADAAGAADHRDEGLAAAGEPAVATAVAAARVGGARHRPRSGPGPMIWLLVAAALLVLVALALALLRPDLFGRTGGAALDSRQDALAIASNPSARSAAPAATGDTLAYAVQVRAYVSLTSARNQAEQQQRRVPETLFYVVPEQTQGVLYYKVLAGVLTDTAAATALRSRLVDAGVIMAADARDDAPGAWSLIQSRPLAFELGTFETLEAAALHADSLASLGVPTYPVPVPFTDGSTRWRLYAGAYPDERHALEMRQILADARIPAQLVQRIGRAPATAP